eukprot:5750801-Amphidinium_carterae.1
MPPVAGQSARGPRPTSGRTRTSVGNVHSDTPPQRAEQMPQTLQVQPPPAADVSARMEGGNPQLRDAVEHVDLQLGKSGDMPAASERRELAYAPAPKLRRDSEATETVQPVEKPASAVMVTVERTDVQTPLELQSTQEDRRSGQDGEQPENAIWHQEDIPDAEKPKEIGLEESGYQYDDFEEESGQLESQYEEAFEESRQEQSSAALEKKEGSLEESRQEESYTAPAMYEESFEESRQEELCAAQAKQEERAVLEESIEEQPSPAPAKQNEPVVTTEGSAKIAQAEQADDGASAYSEDQQEDAYSISGYESFEDESGESGSEEHSAKSENDESDFES